MATSRFALTTGVVYVRSFTGSFSGDTILVGDGTAAAPTYSYSADTNTGEYRAAADTIGVAVGGVQVGQWDVMGLHVLNGVLTGASANDAFLSVTGTLPSSTSASVNGVRISITGNGTPNNRMRAMDLNLLAGYTGANLTAALSVSNSSAGTATAAWTGQNANYGGYVQQSASTAGHGVGLLGAAGGSSAMNMGLIGTAQSATNTPALNVGVAGVAGSATVNVGGYFGLTTTAPTLATAALVADNGAIAAPIAEFRDNGTAVVTVADGGGVGIGIAPIAAAKLQVKTAADDDVIFQNVSGLTQIGFMNDAGGAYAGAWIDSSALGINTFSGGVTTFGGTVNVTGAVTATTSLKTGAVAVASLPTCNAGAQGTRYFVTDANATTFAATVAAGGANKVPVVCDGTNWIIG
jgi:hypothetical protein